jgi:hypothetical protein
MLEIKKFNVGYAGVTNPPIIMDDLCAAAAETLGEVRLRYFD